MRNLLTALATSMSGNRAQRVVDASKDPQANSSSTNKHPAPDRNVVPDIELLELFSHDWAANAHKYRQTLSELRAAAQRQLPLVRERAKYQALPENIRARLDRLSDEIPCLARQPLFYPEMFHAVRLMPDGTFSPLSHHEMIHLRASGLLGVEDRVAIRKIYERLVRQRSGPLRVVEVGSAVGGGSTRIAGEYVKRSGGILYCIDPWIGCGYFEFVANMQIFDFETAVIPIRSPSVEAAALFPDKSLDAVFVDGSHIYQDVVADIDAYLPKIKKNGYIFGHDLHDVPSRFDRGELLSVANLNNTVVNYTNASGKAERVDVHPGVILAVQDRFGDQVEVFPGSVVWGRYV